MFQIRICAEAGLAGRAIAVTIRVRPPIKVARIVQSFSFVGQDTPTDRSQKSHRVPSRLAGGGRRLPTGRPSTAAVGGDRRVRQAFARRLAVGVVLRGSNDWLLVITKLQARGWVGIKPLFQVMK